MDREVSSVMELGYGLALLAALLSIVLSGVFIGKKLGYDFLNKAEVVQQEMQDGALRDINCTSIEMPTASLIAMLKLNEPSLYLIHDSVNNGEGDIASDAYKYLMNHISGRVRVYVEFNKEYAGYEVWIHEIECLDAYKHDLGGC